MDEKEIRLRCIEAAAKMPQTHPSGYAVGVVDTAEGWTRFVRGDNPVSIKEQLKKVFGR